MDERVVRLVGRRSAAAGELVQLREQRNQITVQAEREHRDELTADEDYLFRSLTGQITAKNEELRQFDERITELSEETTPAAPTAGALAVRGLGAGATTPGIKFPSWSEYRAAGDKAEFSLFEERAIAEASNAFVPSLQATRWYDRIRAASVFLQARPEIIQVDGAALNVPRVSGSGTAAMIAENTAFTATDPTFAAVPLVPKKAYYFNLVSNEALDDSQPSLQGVLATAFARDLGTLIDQQLLTGNGSAPNLRGAVNFTGATAVSNGANGTQLSTQTNLDLFAAPLGQLQALNADLSRAAWFIHPALWAKVRTIKDSGGRYQLQNWGQAPEQDIAPTLFGIPVFVSSNLPSNQTVGTSTDCSTVVLADMSQVIVGWRRQIGVEMSRDYAFNADQTAIRLIARLDVQPITAAATVVITGLRAS